MGNMIRVEDHDGVAMVRLAHGKVSALDIEFCHSRMPAGTCRRCAPKTIRRSVR